MSEPIQARSPEYLHQENSGTEKDRLLQILTWQRCHIDLIRLFNRYCQMNYQHGITNGMKYECIKMRPIAIFTCRVYTIGIHRLGRKGRGHLRVRAVS